MAMMKSERLRELTAEELAHQLHDLEEELFNLRVRRSLQPPDNPLRLRQLRKQLARVKTIMRESELGIVPRGGNASQAKKT